ncbi:thioredoxin family protein [Leptolyngbya sp. FACHB-261]|uniref:thioredoxin family protein n=1 Tax=Leptolyngbya sp. FACHB-261 TaxID=2692806 RepID=UPI0016823D1D|nr:thioredoxin family protein [Leptolyngbya sp. FACHB-261]MBD2101396.1 thioredoxin family protein [Leptolyngbya sp. FACHB-261]
MALTYSTKLDIGIPAPDFQLPGTDGETYSLASFAPAPALVVVFTCNHCPYARAIEDRLIATAQAYQPRGAQFVAISANDAQNYPDDSFEKMQERAHSKNYPFPYLYDESQAVAKAYDAVCTPDLYIFDAERKLVYHGRFDDNWKESSQVTRKDLELALEEVLAGKPVSFDQLPSMGCNIKWRAA